MRMQRSATFPSLACLCLAACLSPLERGLAVHTLPIDKNGHLETGQIPAGQDSEHAAREHARTIAQNFRASGTTKLLLYLHGGLVSLRTSAKESRELRRLMLGDGYYPVFVNWETGFGKAYGGHLTRGRNGKPTDANSRAGAPFRFVLDAVDVAANSPRAWFASGSDAVHSNSIWHKRNDPPLMDGLRRCDGQRRFVCVDPGSPSGANKFLRGTQWFVQAPFKLVFTPIVYTGGEAAWYDMVRRTRLVFENDDEFWPEQTTERMEPYGALSILLQELAESPGPPIRVTLVAHSMGTIVGNTILRRYAADARLEFERIVYLGAAASVADSFDALAPYLQAHVQTEFFNVMLHPFAEDRERSAAGFAPDGSLLVWIDSMFGHPHSFLERTFGRWANVKVALHLVPGNDKAPCAIPVRERMHFHVLGFGANPETHGALNDAEWAFWRDDFLLGK
jgi:pimeloyl-ACP methyl ester carboxylesterase